MTKKNKTTIEERKKEIINLIETNLTQFSIGCQANLKGMIFHQDAFAAGYSLEECLVLGCAIKYAGMHGKEITIIGTNRETLKK